MQKLSGHQIKIIVFFFPIVCFLCFLVLKIVSPAQYELIIQEDSVIEYAQAFFYLSSSVFAFIVSIRFLKNRYRLHGMLYAILGVGLMLAAGEEISWGQRLFDIKNPAYFSSHNIQAELTLHNLAAIQPYLHDMYILVGFYGTFSWFFLSRSKIKREHIFNFVVPEWFMSSYFLFVLLVYTYFEKVLPVGVNALGYEELLLGGFFLWRDQEPVELLLSLGFLVFAVANDIKTRRMFPA